MELRSTTAGLDHLVMEIALETFWDGVAQAETFQDDLAQRAGVGITMGSTTMVAAVRRFGAINIAMLTQRPGRSRRSQQDIRNELRELDGEDLEALLTLGTALPAASVAADAERWLGKPVLSVNVVSYSHAIRKCGIDDRIFRH